MERREAVRATIRGRCCAALLLRAGDDNGQGGARKHALRSRARHSGRPRVLPRRTRALTSRDAETKIEACNSLLAASVRGPEIDRCPPSEHADALEGASKLYESAGQASLDPVDLLIIQPTPFCNIDCSYCYLSDRSDRRRIALDTIEAIAKFLCDVPVSNPLTICWHAGEPLIIPIPFYERAFDCFVDSSRTAAVQHSFQTNATLINDDWCEFFKRWSVSIGVSVDGPRAVHDAHRVDRSGRGTFDRVMHGISKLREHEIPFSVISVLTKESLNAADEIWEFYRSNNITQVGFNIDEEEGDHDVSSLIPSEHLTTFRKFMSRIADLQEQDPAIEVRELDSMRRYLAAPPRAEVKKSDNRPGAILNIDVDGNLTTFSPELLGRVHSKYGKFAWGNVHVDSWERFVRNALFQRARADIEAGVALCREVCAYSAICGGGCPSNKLAEHDTFVAAETKSCRFQIQAVADVIIERLERKIGHTPFDVISSRMR